LSLAFDLVPILSGHGSRRPGIQAFDEKGFNPLLFLAVFQVSLLEQSQGFLDNFTLRGIPAALHQATNELLPLSG
jgi:hypothetical protein